MEIKFSFSSLMNLPEAIDTFLVNKALDIQQQYQQKLTDPTTIRYSSYAGHLLSFNGVLPNPFPLLLKSVICSIKSTLVLSDSNTILISNKASSTHYLNQIIHHDVSLTLNHATFAFNAGFVLPGSFQVLDHMISNAPNGFDFHITFEAIDTSLLRPYSYKRFFSKIDIKQSLLRLSKVYPVDNSNVHDICKVFPISFEFAVFCLFHYNQYASDFIKDLLPKLSPNVLDSITNRVSIQQRTSSTSLPRSISETSSYITRSVSDSRIEEINQRYETKQDIIPVSDNRDSNSSSRVSLEEDYYHKTTQLKQDRIKSKTELENTLDSLRNRQTESKIKSPSPILRKSPSPRNKSVKTSKLLNQFGDLLNELDSIDTVNNDGLDVADNEVLSLWGLVVNEMTNEDIHSGKHNPNLQQKAESIVPSAPMNPSSMKTFQGIIKLTQMSFPHQSPLQLQQFQNTQT